MKINVMSVMVDDQAKALRFYTEVLGFVKKNEIGLAPARPWRPNPDGRRGAAVARRAKLTSRTRVCNHR